MKDMQLRLSARCQNRTASQGNPGKFRTVSGDNHMQKRRLQLKRIGHDPPPCSDSSNLPLVTMGF
jgi:hypothetical protein